jgi:hypothetical protein
MKSEQGMDQGRLAGAVRTQQADRAAAQFSSQAFQNLSLTESNTQIIEVDYRSEILGVLESSF